MSFKAVVYSYNPIVEVGLSSLIKKHISNTSILKLKTLDCISSPSFNLNYDVYIFDVFTFTEMQVIALQLAPLIAEKKVVFLVDSPEIEKILPFNNITYLHRDSSALDIVKKIRNLKNLRKKKPANIRFKSEAKCFQKDTTFSSREFECATLLMRGYSTSQISKKLSLAMSTVSTYKNRIHKT